MGGFNILKPNSDVNPGMDPETLQILMGIHPSQVTAAAQFPQQTPAPMSEQIAGHNLPPADTTPTIARSASSGPPPINLPMQAHEAELNRLTNPDPLQNPDPTNPGHSQSESGIQKFSDRHHILGPIARVGAAIGSAAFPAIAQAIPGTDLHHQALVGQAQQNVGNDVAIQEKESQTNEQNARADLYRNPQPKLGTTPEETTIHDLMTGNNGQPRLDPQGNPYSYLSAYQAVHQALQDTKPDPTVKLTPFDLWKQQNPQGTFEDYQQASSRDTGFDKYYKDWLVDNSAPDNAHNRLMARKEYQAAGRAPEQAPKIMAIGPDGKVLELHPGDTMPQGAMTASQQGQLNAGSQQLSEPAKKILMETEPVKAQVKDILQRLEPLKENNDAGYLLGARAKYAVGIASPEGTLADDIGKIEMDRVVGAARVLKGSSRAYQALEMAMTHLPSTWKDSPKLMYSKLSSVLQNLEDVENDATTYGTKSLSTGQANQGLQNRSPSGTPAGGGGVTVTDPKGGIHKFPDKASADAFKREAGIP